ncbi:MAG: hypothetical protein ACQEUT_17640 [Bacillota bacterium]
MTNPLVPGRWSWTRQKRKGRSGTYGFERCRNDKGNTKSEAIR